MAWKVSCAVIGLMTLLTDEPVSIFCGESVTWPSVELAGFVTVASDFGDVVAQALAGVLARLMTALCNELVTAFCGELVT